MCAFILRCKRRIIFYCTDGDDYYDEDKQPQRPIFVSSTIELSNDGIITSMETLIKNPNSTFEKSFECIEDLINLDDIQKNIQNTLSLCPEEADILVPCQISRKRTSSVRLLQKVSLLNSTLTLPSDISSQSPISYRKYIKPRPPLFFAVSQSLLKWINASRRPKVDRLPNVDVQDFQNHSTKERIIYTPISCDTASTHGILSDIPFTSQDQLSSISTPSHSPILKKVNQDLIDLNLFSPEKDAFFNLNCQQITTNSTIDRSSNESDSTSESCQRKWSLKNKIHGIMEPSMSTDIEDDEDNCKSDEKISLAGCVVESDDKYFYIYSEFVKSSDIHFIKKK